ncbi:hypothetical protein NST58_12925 [Paenibacillus sp. FSL R10-2796]|uniref:hypothetical protein n=1 Tax=Paenibacillus sp. FSL R10-2796 TaxID=2954663 RepID=UPI0030DA8DA9
MTQVKDKTDQQLNRALAELMGYTVEWSKTQERWSLMIGRKIRATSSGTEDLIWTYAPDYCTDPAASLEVQAKAIEVDAKMYVWNLSIVKWKDAVEPEEIDGWESINLEDIGDLLTASPRERAEAAYITLSQVEEGSRK